MTILTHKDIVEKMPAEGNLAPPHLIKNRRICLFLGVIFYVVAFGTLYYKYVPRVLDFQLVLIPVVLVTIIVTANSIRYGTLLVVFFIPIVNSLPYFYGLSGFNPLFFVFYGLVLGLLIHQAVHPEVPSLKNPLLLPVIGISLVLIVSGVITFWRYTNFFPLNGPAVHELAVNVLNVSTGEALRRVLFDGLNYLGGFIWFFVVINVFKARQTVRAVISLFAISSLLAFLFGFYQSAKNMELGNQAWFVQSNRINALFSDPNALGVFLVLSIPAFAGIALARKKLGKALFLMPILVGIWLIPDSGSRVGMLGLAVAFAVFVFLLLRLGLYARKINPDVWKSVLRHSVVAVLLLGLISVFVLINRDSNLHYRLSENIKSLKVLFNPKAREIILHGRHLTWPSSLHMMREYPVSGIGVGAYISELPNFYKKYEITPITSSFYYRGVPAPDIRVDSAGNYYLHVASEMGFIGLFFFAWIFVLVLRQIFRDHFRRKDLFEWSFLGIGLSSSLLAMFVILLLGVHTLHFEILLTFWLFVGLLYSISPAREDRESIASVKLPPILRVLAGILVVVYGTVLVWNSFSRLSLKERTERFHLNQEFGLYQKEKMDGRSFRWTGKIAGMTIKANKPAVVVPVLVSHPDIGDNPVEVRVYLTDDLFRTKTLLDEFILKDTDWKERRYDFSDRIGSELIMIFEVSRTWRPKDVLDSPDPRSLGIAVGKVRFEDPPRVADETPEQAALSILGNVLYRFEPSGGEREMGGKPPHSTEWRIDASMPEGDFLFRLRAKGQEAGKEWPLAGLWIDGRLVSEDWITPDTWDYYFFRVKLKAGTHKIRVAFMNEAYIAQTREYRKLIIESLEIARKRER